VARHSNVDDGLVAARLDALAPPAAAQGWVPDGALTLPDPPPVAPVAPAGSAASGPRGVLAWWQQAQLSPEVSRTRWLVVAAVGAVVIVGYLMLHRSAVSQRPPESYHPLPAPSVAVTASAGPQIVVDVGGRVRHPGLVTLPAGSRVADALAAAGGALRSADIATLDLAARVSDGQLLLIGVPGAAQPVGAAGSGPVDLNAASADQLDALPGVGPVLAQHIVDWRQSHGGFTSVDQLRQVPGIGPRKFDDLKSLVTV
jgi:competence protein ComEA